MHGPATEFDPKVIIGCDEICRFGETRAYLIGIYRFGEIWANLVWKLCRPKERKKRVGEIK